MSKSYSQDLRDRVLLATSEGSSARQAAARFDLGVSTAIVWVRRERETGVRTALPRGHPRGSKLDAHEEFLLCLVREKPDITLEEMSSELNEQHGVSVAISTLWKFLGSRDLTFKKNSARR